MGDFIQVSTATGSQEAGVALAGSAVEARLAAGAQVIGPVASVYWHRGEFGTGEEWQILLKTTVDRYAELEAHLIANHGWQNPEIVAVPILTGSGDYLDWIRKTVAPDGDA
jgi:periplasmic divalent cation tolerance protein